MIEAMTKVEAALPSASLVIVGEEPLRAELEQLAAVRLKRYRFVGVQSSDQVREWYRKAWLLCAPSITAASGETEGLPITVLEAQAMGLPGVQRRDGRLFG